MGVLRLATSKQGFSIPTMVMMLGVSSVLILSLFQTTNMGFRSQKTFSDKSEFVSGMQLLSLALTNRHTCGCNINGRQFTDPGNPTQLAAQEIDLFNTGLRSFREGSQGGCVDPRVIFDQSTMFGTATASGLKLTNFMANGSAGNYLAEMVVTVEMAEKTIGQKEVSYRIPISLSGTINQNTVTIDGCGQTVESEKPAWTNIIAVHSQTNSVPNCPQDWNSLWIGYSFVGMHVGDNRHTSADLGDASSCLKNFVGTTVANCWTDSNCRIDHHGFSQWLTSSSGDTPFVINQAAINLVARCRVCEKPATVKAFHSQAANLPSCPDGWTSLWTGFSFAGSDLSEGYDVSPDLTGPGSCLKIFRPMPIVECRWAAGCDVLTPGDNSRWIGAIGAPHEVTMSGSGNLQLVSKCRVCEKDPPP